MSKSEFFLRPTSLKARGFETSARRPQGFSWLITLKSIQQDCQHLNRLRSWLYGVPRVAKNLEWNKKRESEALNLKREIEGKINCFVKDPLQRSYLREGNFDFLLSVEPSLAFDYLMKIFSRARQRGIKMTSSQDELKLKKVARTIYTALKRDTSSLPFSLKKP